ncbi:hypothetical protein A6P39_001560 [Streptomyces sp. FXJ1.172]|nr:hypothetical protein [Streptomyces sp. FXJ1.172]WEP00491.1 hypothetical protein A6P39_001560 [Streptomyces sp. FXJ1.172]
MTNGRDNIVVPGWSAISRTPASTAIAAAPMKIHTDVMRPSGCTGRASSRARTSAAVSRYCIRPTAQHTTARTASACPGVTRASDAAATATDSDPTDHRNQVPFTWSSEGPRFSVVMSASGMP